MHRRSNETSQPTLTTWTRREIRESKMSPSGNPDQYNTPSSITAATVRISPGNMFAEPRGNVLLLMEILSLAMFDADICRQKDFRGAGDVDDELRNIRHVEPTSVVSDRRKPVIE